MLKWNILPEKRDKYSKYCIDIYGLFSWVEKNSENIIETEWSNWESRGDEQKKGHRNKYECR